MKKLLFVLMTVLLCVQTVHAEEEIDVPSAVLMEASTGRIIYEKNPDEKLPPASVTKIMTLLLIFEALEEEKIHRDDQVRVSEYAASMGGSQVFLEEGEMQTVETMIKCIAVSSANDATVAMAEHIFGTEEKFVKKMNEKAASLGMKNTRFKNCNGLDVKGHVTTARDIALMAKELITKHPDIFHYTKIWMDEIVHETKKGKKKFGLSNTNKLIRYYEYATGLKTGSTDEAGFCLCATAKKDEIELISVVMAAKSAKKRVSESIKLLDYGFSMCTRYEDKEPLKKNKIAVSCGVKKEAKIEAEGPFTYVKILNETKQEITKKEKIKKKIKAPAKKGEDAGYVHYFLDGKEIGKVKVVLKQDVRKRTVQDALSTVFLSFLL